MEAHARRLPRRDMLRLLAAVPALGPALASGEAAARRTWCRTDPVVVEIDGQEAHVYVSAWVRNRREARRLADGPPRLVLRVPPGVERDFVAADNSLGYKADVKFEEAAELAATEAEVELEVLAHVPMEDREGGAVEILVEFEPLAGDPQVGDSPLPGSGGDGGVPGSGAARWRLRPGRGEGTANDWLRFRAPAAGEEEAPTDGAAAEAPPAAGDAG